MSLWKEQIEKGKIRCYFSGRDRSTHRFMKNQMNRYLRRLCKDIDQDTYIQRPKRMYKGWEY